MENVKAASRPIGSADILNRLLANPVVRLRLLDDLEGAAGGLILETEDGRYMAKDEFNGRVFYMGDSLERAREAAMRHDLSTRVMTTGEYERRSGKKQ